MWSKLKIMLLNQYGYWNICSSQSGSRYRGIFFYSNYWLSSFCSWSPEVRFDHKKSKLKIMLYKQYGYQKIGSWHDLQFWPRAFKSENLAVTKSTCSSWEKYARLRASDCQEPLFGYPYCLCSMIFNFDLIQSNLISGVQEVKIYMAVIFTKKSPESQSNLLFCHDYSRRKCIIW